MRITVVIPTLNEQEQIVGAIASAWDAGADHVIVSDGGSQDATCQRASGTNATVVHTNPCRGVQLNLGAAAAADSDLLLFLHADCRLPKSAGVQIRDCVQSSKISWGGFVQKIDAPGWRYRWLERGNLMRARIRGMLYGDQGIWVRSPVFHQVGGFPDWPLMEDTGLSDRLRYHRWAVLPGPLLVDARRWKRHGLVWQTARNWFIYGAFRAGVSPQRLKRFYHRSPHSK